jgi:hypothetical protein
MSKSDDKVDEAFEKRFQDWAEDNIRPYGPDEMRIAWQTAAWGRAEGREEQQVELEQLQADFYAVFDGLQRIAHAKQSYVTAAMAQKYLEPVAGRWEWMPGEAPYVRRITEAGEERSDE